MSKKSLPKPKDLPEGSLAKILSYKEAKRLEPLRRRAKLIGVIAAAATVVGFGAPLMNEMDKTHKQDVAEDAAREAMREGRVNGVDVNTNFYLREGVTVRTEPKIISAKKGERGNELLTVGKNEVLVISSPLQITNEDGKSFMLFTLNDGRTGYVSNKVIGQEDDKGNRFVIVAPEQQPSLPEQLDIHNLELNQSTGTFSIDGYQVATAQIMNPEQALIDIA